MYKGLLNHITTPQFIANLCLMADALAPLSELSCALQNRDIGVVTAHKLMLMKIRLFQSRKDTPVECYSCYTQRENDREFVCGKSANRAISLTGKAYVRAIRPPQFYQSLVASLEARLLTKTSRKGASNVVQLENSNSYATLLNQFQVLEIPTWPAAMVPDYGRSEISTLAKRFGMAGSNVNILREFEV